MFDDTIFGNPVYDPSRSFIHSKASVIGVVILEENVFISPGASIRADECAPFLIRKGTNIQDNVTIHGLHNSYFEVGGKKYSVYIDSHCSIAHCALVHGPVVIGKKTFVGFRTIIFKSRIGRNCFIGHGAIVEGVTIADNRFVPSGAVIDKQGYADELPSVPADKREFNKGVVDENKRLCDFYRERRLLKLSAGE
jgi:carbonic anhydrase/acetyltransferase-like protein (isoleucine patch superfamily)